MHADKTADTHAGTHWTPEGFFTITYLTHPKPAWYWATQSDLHWRGPYPTSEAAYNAAYHWVTPDFE